MISNIFSRTTTELIFLNKNFPDWSFLKLLEGRWEPNDPNKKPKFRAGCFFWMTGKMLRKISFVLTFVWRISNWFMLGLFTWQITVGYPSKSPLTVQDIFKKNSWKLLNMIFSVYLKRYISTLNLICQACNRSPVH